jgi:hypothetical protein
MVMQKALVAVSIVALCFGFNTLTASAKPIVFEVKFSNCTQLNKVYPGGVAKSKTVRNKGGKTKKTPTVNAKVYAENSSKDRDKDGIACEK